MMIVGYNGEDDADLFSEAAFKSYDRARDYLFGVDAQGGFEGALMEEVNGLNTTMRLLTDQRRLVLAHKTDIARCNLARDALRFEGELNDLGSLLTAAQKEFKLLADPAYTQNYESPRFSATDPFVVQSEFKTAVSKLVNRFSMFSNQVRVSLSNRSDELMNIVESHGYEPMLYGRIASLDAVRENTYELFARLHKLLGE